MSILLKQTSYTFKPGTPGQAQVLAQPARAAYTEYVREPVTFATQGSITIMTDDGPRTFPSGAMKITTGYVIRAVYHPATPAVPAVTGIPFTPTTYAKISNTGWTSGARSIQDLPASGTYSFSVPSSVSGVVTGLSRSTDGPNYEAIDYGFYLTHGRAVVMENGVSKTGPMVYTSASSFTVKRIGSTMHYLLDNVAVYTSKNQVAQPMIAGAALYAPGDTVEGASLTSLAAGYGTSTIGPLDAAGQDGERNMGMSRMLPIAIEISGRRYDGGVSRMRPLASVSSDYIYSAGSSVLEPVFATGNAGKMIPTYAVSISSLGFIQSASHGLTGGVGTAETSMLPMVSLAADHPYGMATTSLLPLESVGYKLVAPEGYALLSLPKRPTLIATGTQGESNSFVFSYSGKLTANAGAFAMMKAARPHLLATGTGTIIGRAYLVAPNLPTLTATGITGGIAKAVMVASRPSVIGYSGAVLSVRIGGEVTVMGSGMRGAVGRAVMRLPLCKLVASGTSGAYGRARIVAPAIIPAPSGRAHLSAKYHLVAYGSAVVTASFEGYAVNMLADPGASANQPEKAAQVTHYTNFPFTQIVRHEGKYYGVAPDGLYLLDGDTDAGEPIAWSFRTALTDMNSKQLKRVKSVYVGARLLHEVTVTLVVGESEDLTYAYTTPRGSNAQSYRQKFGKGMRTRYFALEMSDPAGNFIEIDSLDPEVDILERAI